MSLSANTGGASEAALATIASLENRGWRVKLLAAVALGLVLGGLIGGAVFGILRSTTTATSFVRLSEPVDLTALAGGASQTTPNTQGNQENFVTGEVAYLSGDGFAEQVGEKLGKLEPASFEVTQNGSTAVVTISATDEDPDVAVRTVDTIIELYRQQLAQQADRQLRSILPALARWESDAPYRHGDIQALRERVELQANPENTLVILQPTFADEPSDDRWMMGTLLGALLLGSLLPVLLLGRRRRAGLLASDPELATAIDSALIPAIDLRQPSRHAWGPEQATLARTLWAQLPSAVTRRTIVVVGASGKSGSAAVACLLHFAAAENGSVETVTLASWEGDSITTNGRSTTIIDAGALGSSRLTADAIRTATDIVLVARLGVDSVSQGMAVRSASKGVDAPLIAVFTHRGWWDLGSAGGGRKRPREKSTRDEDEKDAVESDQPPTDT